VNLMSINFSTAAVLIFSTLLSTGHVTCLAQQQLKQNQQESVEQINARIKQLVKEINIDPEIFHGDYTPAVYELIGIGRPAVGPCLKLFLSGDEDTRLRASRVITGIIYREHGFRMGLGFTIEGGEEKCRKLFKENGTLDYLSSEDVRKKEVGNWRRYFSIQDKKTDD
jgi:hypothetical protein